jgi:hypothetical protein
MLGPADKFDLAILKTSQASTLALLVDMLAPVFKGILFEKLAVITFKDLPRLHEGQAWVFQFTQDLGAVWSLYVGTMVVDIPQGPDAKITVVVKPSEHKGDLFFMVDNNKNILRRLDRGPFLAKRDVKGRNYATLTSSHLLERLKTSN